MSRFNLAGRLLALILVLTMAPAFAGPRNHGAEPAADAQTKLLVERRLRQDDLAPFHRIEVTVANGVVTLRGSVRTTQTRDAVIREVNKVAGVKEVHVDLKVQPTP